MISAVFTLVSKNSWDFRLACSRVLLQRATSPIAARLLNRRFEFAANDLEFASVEFESTDADKQLLLKIN